MNFPSYTLPIDDEIENIIENDIFETTHIDFPEYWNAYGKNKMSRTVYKKVPKSDQNIYIEPKNKLEVSQARVTTEKVPYMKYRDSEEVLDLNLWEPMLYPIFNIGYDINLNVIFSAFQSINEDLPLNSIRCMFQNQHSIIPNNPKKPVKEYAIRKGIDLIEALYFKNKVPKSVTIKIDHFDYYLKPTGKYLFLGMLFYTLASFNNIYISFEVETSEIEVENLYSFNIIGWLFRNPRSLNTETIYSCFYDDNNKYKISYCFQNRSAGVHRTNNW
jgi:hypothetical protein